MRYYIIIILTVLIQSSFGQIVIKGVVKDSVSNNLIPFAVVSIDKENETITDLDGKFQMTVANRESLVITVSATGYWPKKFEIKEPFDSLNLTLRQVSLYDPSNFIITSKPTDTIYFENGKIRRIEYQGHNVEDFYINGQIRYKCANSSTRSWYDNGQLKSQSLLKNPHLRIDTEWYSNGQKKSEGSTFFRYNEKRNEGEWINNDDWKYWTKKGKERKRKSKH